MPAAASDKPATRSGPVVVDHYVEGPDGVTRTTTIADTARLSSSVTGSVGLLGEPIPFNYTIDMVFRIRGRNMNPDTTGIFCNTLEKDVIAAPSRPNVTIRLWRDDTIDDVIGTITYTNGANIPETHCFPQVPDLSEDYYFEYTKASDNSQIAGHGTVF